MICWTIRTRESQCISGDCLERTLVSGICNSAFRLCAAIEMIEDSWNRSDGIRPDLDPEYEGIQAWLWVPNLYQLIEQSFKLLLQHKNQNASNIHRLSDLYASLESNYRTMLDSSYCGYRELYNYLPDETLKSFLEQADRGKRRETKRPEDGYTTWRYMLLEGFPSTENEIPKIHIGAMLETSIAARDIIQRDIILEGECNPIMPINLRIQSSLLEEFNSIGQKYCSRKEVQAQVLDKPGLLQKIRFERVEYCRDLLSRNLVWAYSYVKSSPCLELDQENTRIMEAICQRMKRDHKHDFLQYIQRLESGGMKLFEVPNSWRRI